MIRGHNRTTASLDDYQIQHMDNPAQHSGLEPRFLLSRATEDYPSSWALVVELSDKGFVRARDWLLEFTCLAYFGDLWRFDAAMLQRLTNEER